MAVTRTAIMLSAILIFAAPSAALADSQRPVFGAGSSTETFVLLDQHGRTPTFRVLKDTVAEKALARAVITTVNLSPKVQPKVPVTDYIDLKLDELKVTPDDKNPDQLHLSVKLNGHELELPETVSKKTFLSGQPIDMEFPDKDKSVAVFEVQSGGHFKFRFQKSESRLRIDDALGRLSYNSPLMGEGNEQVRFSGTGIRKL